MKIALAGAGAFGEKHLDGLAWLQLDAASRDGVSLGCASHFLFCNPVCEFTWVSDLLQLVFSESWVASGLDQLIGS